MGGKLPWRFVSFPECTKKAPYSKGATFSKPSQGQYGVSHVMSIPALLAGLEYHKTTSTMKHSSCPAG